MFIINSKKDMDYRFRISQEELNYIYENAKGRMDANPDIAENHKKEIEKYPFFKTEKEALQAAIKMRKDNHYGCQIWAKIEKTDGIYRIVNYWLVTDDGKIKLSADYIGMALMYDERRLQKIIKNNIAIDDIIAYF